MNARSKPPSLNRRGFLAASAVGLGAAALTASAMTTASASTDSPASARDSAASFQLSEAILAAFRTHRLVGLGEEHQMQEHHDALQTLLADPRLPGVVNDIVVEFGNALYQDTIDAFVLNGQPIADTDLRPVWRNTTQSPGQTWDAPVYEQFFRRLRAINSVLTPTKRIRVLLGDPPVDWSKITSNQQLRPFLDQRYTHPASVIEQEVLAKGRRALLCYGGYDLLHTSDSNSSIVSLIEQQTGVRTYTIADLVTLQGDPGGLTARLAEYPRNSVIPTAHTWLGQINAGYALPAAAQGQPSPLCGVPLGELQDAGLYLEAPAQLTASRPNPAIYLDPTYWAELQRRNAIGGKGGQGIDLTTYLQDQPPGYPPLPAPAC